MCLLKWVGGGGGGGGGAPAENIMCMKLLYSSFNSASFSLTKSVVYLNMKLYFCHAYVVSVIIIINNKWISIELTPSIYTPTTWNEMRGGHIWITFVLVLSKCWSFCNQNIPCSVHVCTGSPDIQAAVLCLQGYSSTARQNWGYKPSVMKRTPHTDSKLVWSACVCVRDICVIKHFDFRETIITN